MANANDFLLRAHAKGLTLKGCIWRYRKDDYPIKGFDHNGLEIFVKDDTSLLLPSQVLIDEWEVVGVNFELGNGLSHQVVLETA